MKNKIIFDVGAYDGIDGLALAIKNPNFFIYAFEANPSLIDRINLNHALLEKRIGKKNAKPPLWSDERKPYWR